jgi:hypothetical protein
MYNKIMAGLQDSSAAVANKPEPTAVAACRSRTVLLQQSEL